MTSPKPFPEGHPRKFRATVHGIAFGDRARVVEGMKPGDACTLVPDPPIDEEPEVWVHVREGDPIGHLPQEIAAWLWPWLARGGVASARAVKVRGDDVPSWRRVLLEVVCG